MAKVRTFNRYFPKGHPKERMPTYFVEKIYKSLYLMKSVPKELDSDFNFAVMNDDNYKPKHHTIRSGNHFKKGDLFSPRVWSAKPYASPQIIIAPDIKITEVYDISILVIDFHPHLGYQATITINGKNFTNLEVLAQNDGLSVDDFLGWFYNKKEEVFEGQIICWSDILYK